MDSFEINKIITAILLVVLLVFGVGKISDIIFKTNKPDIDGYKVEIKTQISWYLKQALKAKLILCCFLSNGRSRAWQKSF